MTGSKPPPRRWSRLSPGRALPGCQRCAGHGGPGQGPGAERARGTEGRAPSLRDRTQSARTARRPAPTADALPRSPYLSPPARSNCLRAAGGAGAAQPLLIRPVPAKLRPQRPESAGALRQRKPACLYVPLSRVIPGCVPPWARFGLAQSCGRIFVHPLFTKAIYARLSSQAPLPARPLQRHYANRVRRPSLAAAPRKPLRKPRTPPVRGAGWAAKWPGGERGGRSGGPGLAAGAGEAAALSVSARGRPSPVAPGCGRRYRRGAVTFPRVPQNGARAFPLRRLTPGESLPEASRFFFFFFIFFSFFFPLTFTTESVLFRQYRMKNESRDIHSCSLGNAPVTCAGPCSLYYEFPLIFQPFLSGVFWPCMYLI